MKGARQRGHDSWVDLAEESPGAAEPVDEPNWELWALEQEPLQKTKPRLIADSCFTYVIVARASGVKIGHSKRPAGRLSEMQVGSPVDLWMGHTWRLTSDGAKELERRLHQAFLWARTKGEWFDLFPPEVVAVGDLLLAGNQADAARLAGLIRERREVEARLLSLRYVGHGYRDWRDRKKAEAEAKAEVPVARRRLAAVELEALDLGLWMHNKPNTLAGRNQIARLKREAGLA